MNLQKGYYYVFYKFYKFAKESHSVFPSDFVATLFITILEVLSLFSLKIYYKYFHRDDTLTFLSFEVVVPLVVIFLINHFAFISNNKWKKYVLEFDKLSKNQNLQGSRIVGAVIILIIVNLGYSLYLIGIINGDY